MGIQVFGSEPIIQFPVSVQSESGGDVSAVAFSEETIILLIDGLETVRELILPLIPNVFARTAAKWAFGFVVHLLRESIKQQPAPRRI